MMTTALGGGGLLALAVTSLLVISSTYAQQAPVGSPCTSSMLTSFTPCMNFLTNSSSAGTSPTADCCNSLRSLMTNGKDCVCQILTAGVPFSIPVNRTLAISLPKACNQPRVPLQCKASAGAPVPAPGPTVFSPSISPAAGPDAPAPSGATPRAETPAVPPVSDTTPEITPPTSTTGTGGSTPTPSSTVPSLAALPSLLFSMAIMVIYCF